MFDLPYRDKLEKVKFGIRSGLVLIFLLFGILDAQNRTEIVYEPSDAVIFNPERGFSTQISGPITSSLAASMKAQNISLIHRLYIIPEYRNTALPQSFLDLMEQDLSTAREGGMKVIIRFSYTDDKDGPDAALDTILMHIGQIAPVLQENFDVVAYMEAGFIGAWGEWYFSTHHLNNTEDRRTVLYALLDALPTERMVAVRTPNYKRLILGDDTPLTPEEAFSGTRKARIGAHNDCFLASATDYGTYLQNDIEGDKNYLNLDNRFVPQGGETCNPSEYSDCIHALTDLERMHWSVLNKDYHPDVLAQWESGGCMEEIKRRLGYQFELLNAILPDSLPPGGAFQLDFDLRNVGFASPYNPRLLEVILRNAQTRKTYRLVTDEDPRFWMSGDTVQVTISGGIPQEIPAGGYEVLLHLADSVDALRYRPEYAIRLANQEVWEDSTGYNNLGHILVIDPVAAGELYSGDNYFEPFAAHTPPPPPPAKIIIDGQFGDWNGITQLDQAPDEENAGDALTDAVDIVDIWVGNDDENLFISYRLAGEHGTKYFYHVFFDTDRDPATGFHSANSYAGIDYMIENESIWKYTGTSGEWSWAYAGAVAVSWGSDDPARVELAMPRSVLSEAGASEVVDLVFNVNDLDDNHDDDYAPDAYQSYSYTYNFTTTGLEKTEAIAPEQYQIRVFPNPFNNRVVIRVNASGMGKCNLTIFDISGRRVRSFDHPAGGRTTFIWNGQNDRGQNVGSGLYIIRLSDRQKVLSKKIVLLK